MAATGQRAAVARPTETGQVPRPLRGTGHTEIPNEVIDDPSLDAIALQLWAVLRRRDWHGEGWVWTYAELAAAVGCCAESLRRRLTILEHRGLIRVEGVAKRPKRYFALQSPGSGSLRNSDSAGPPIATKQRSNRYGIAIESLRNSDPSLLKTIKDYQKSSSTESGSTSRAGEAPPGPSAHQKKAVDTITAALAQARGSTVDSERKRGTLDALKAAVLRHLVLGFAGDPRQITAGKVVRCIAYMASKPHVAANPLMITARTVGDELGPWLDAGAPERYEPPPSRQRRPQQAAGPPSTRGPAFVAERPVLCYCLTQEGYPHGDRCGLDGVVTRDNFRDQGDPEQLYTKERPYSGR